MCLSTLIVSYGGTFDQWILLFLYEKTLNLCYINCFHQASGYQFFVFFLYCTGLIIIHVMDFYCYCKFKPTVAPGCDSEVDSANGRVFIRNMGTGSAVQLVTYNENTGSGGVGWEVRRKLQSANSTLILPCILSVKRWAVPDKILSIRLPVKTETVIGSCSLWYILRYTFFLGVQTVCKYYVDWLLFLNKVLTIIGRSVCHDICDKSGWPLCFILSILSIIFFIVLQIHRG